MHLAQGARGAELAWLVAMLSVVLALSLLTGARSPIVGTDDAGYADPAVNLLRGNGFVSSVWYAQGDDEVWAGNVPLYSLLAYGWFCLFGVSVLAARSLNYVLVIAAVVVLWAAVRRLDLVRTAGHRLGMVALVVCGFGICVNYRMGRPDCLCILLASTALWAASIERRRLRLAVLAGLGFLFPIAGLQLVVYAALICLMLLAFARGRYFPESVVLGAGCVLGFGALALVYAHLGVWDGFVASTMGTHSAFGRSVAGLGFWRRAARVPGGVKDPSYLLLLAAVLGLAVGKRVEGAFVWRSPLGFAVAAALAVPALMHGLRSVYPAYYSWMAYIPMCVGVSAMLSTEARTTRWSLGRRATPVLLGAACFIGLPFVTGLTLWTWEDRDPAKVERLVARHVRPGDVVYAEPAAYFAVKDRAARCMIGWRRKELMSPEEKARLDALIVTPGYTAERIRRTFGGSWRPCGAAVVPARPWPLGNKLGSFFSTYHLQAYRRVGDRTTSVAEDSAASAPQTAATFKAPRR